MEKHRKFIEGFLEIIFPSNIYCICCGSVIDKSRTYSLCDDCLGKFRWAGVKTCQKCGKLLNEDYGNNLCRQCLQNSYTFDKGFACVQYGLNEKVPVFSLKYGGKGYIAGKLGQAMYDRLACEDEAEEVEAVIPVPMHHKKQMKRGYNQAGLMGAQVARCLSVPFYHDILKRQRPTEPMSRMNPEERRRNIEGAFAVDKRQREKIESKTVLLVDDIFTTGCTAEECSKVLTAAGVKKIYLLVFAAGANVKLREGDESVEIEPDGVKEE